MPHRARVADGFLKQYRAWAEACPVARARCYEVRSATLGPGNVSGPWQATGLFTYSRAITAN